MRKKRIGDITRNLDNKRVPLNSVEREKKSDNGVYPYIGANNIMGYINEYIFNEKILCLAEDGGSWGQGEICAKIYNEKCWVNNHAHVLAENGNAHLEYLCYFLNYTNLNKYISGSTRGKLTKSVLENIEVPLPSPEEQIAIAKLLSRAETLIGQRKESIDLLDEFLKSTFVRMFGNYDEISSSRLEHLGDNISYLTSGSRGWAQYYSDKGAKFLRIQNIGGGVIRTDNLIYVNPPDSAEAERTRVKEGDLIISITADLGRSSVIPKDFGEAYINQHLALIRLKENINPIYAAFFYNMPFGNNAIQKKNRAAVKSGLNFNDIKSFPILIPPPTLQNDFAQIVVKVEIIKESYKTSLIELENLYGALNQQAFSFNQNVNKIESFDKAILPPKTELEELNTEENLRVDEEGNIIEDKEDKHYGDPFDIDENAARAQGEEFYNLWKQAHDARIEQENLKSALDFATKPRKKGGMKGVKLTFSGAEPEKASEGKDAEHFEWAGDKPKGKPKSAMVWDSVSFQMAARWVKEKYAGYHFTFEMLTRFFIEEQGTFPHYFSSEELRKNPPLNNSKNDIKSFVFLALSDEAPKDFLKLKQEFFNAKKENLKLNLHEEDYQLIKDRSPEERSGIYFTIAE